MLKEKAKLFLTIFIYIFLSIIYLELLFRARVYTIKFDFNLLRIFSFSVAYSLFFLFFIMFFSKKTIRIMVATFIGYITFVYFNQEIYHIVVNGFFSFSITGDFFKALGFFANYVQAFRFGHILYLLPIGVFFGKSYYDSKVAINNNSKTVFDKFKDFDIQYFQIKQPLIVLTSALLVYLATVSSISSVNAIDPTDTSLFTDRDLYIDLYSADSAIYKFGIFTYSQRDIFTLFQTKDVDTETQMLQLDRFIASRPTHEDNEYSGTLENKNFILIMAESLDTYAFIPELTPMLSEIRDDSLYFENYYSPLYYRNTADTEFLVQTSFYPDKGVSLSMDAYVDNYFPNTMPKLFHSYEGVDYKTLSFHNYTDYFYPRTDFHSNALEFDEYYGSVRMGMQEEPTGFTLNHEWQSDIDLMEFVVGEIAKYDHFYANILTVSGHLDYNDKHPIASKHIAEVDAYEEEFGLDIPQDVKYYLAAQMEFDLALTYLIDELKAMDKFDDTVIMIFGDHYAYGLDLDTIWDFDDVKEDGSNLDINNVPMMLYNTGYESKRMPNYMSSIDVMPTISNLFGLDLNYKEVLGNDALDGDDNIVRFANLSFISRDFSYNIIEDEYVIRPGSGLTENDVILINNDLIQEYIYNNMILKLDYFKKKEPL